MSDDITLPWVNLMRQMESNMDDNNPEAYKDAWILLYSYGTQEEARITEQFERVRK